ncbi:hypothetical protein P4O66_011401, partial [Electrophorus voltai]
KQLLCPVLRLSVWAYLSLATPPHHRGWLRLSEEGCAIRRRLAANTNVCQPREASNQRDATLHHTAQGPCYSDAWWTTVLWLQIDGLRQSDTGVYMCISHTALGQASVLARLSVHRNSTVAYSGDSTHDEYFYGTREDLDSGDYVG